jgi:hypothetical protein
LHQPRALSAPTVRTSPALPLKVGRRPVHRADRAAEVTRVDRGTGPSHARDRFWQVLIGEVTLSIDS